MRLALLMAAFLSLFGNSFGSDVEPPFEVADIYHDLRARVLELTPKSMPSFESPPILAVLMETGMEDAAYTLVSAVDGAASLYFTNGGGIIGAGEHANVRSESLKMIEMAKEFLEHMTKVDEFPIVLPGKTSFFVVTQDGVYSYTANEADLGEKRDKKLFPLFHQGHALIYEMQIAEQNSQAEQTDDAE